VELNLVLLERYGAKTDATNPWFFVRGDCYAVFGDLAEQKHGSLQLSDVGCWVGTLGTPKIYENQQLGKFV
jgi:hypothetical protein